MPRNQVEKWRAHAARARERAAGMRDDEFETHAACHRCCVPQAGGASGSVCPATWDQTTFVLTRSLAVWRLSRSDTICRWLLALCRSGVRRNGQRWALEHMQRTLNPFDDSITVDEGCATSRTLVFSPSPAAVSALSRRRRRPARQPLYRRGPAARLHRQHAGIRAHHARLSPCDIGRTGRRSLMLGSTEMKHSV